MVKSTARILYVTDGIAPWVVGGMQAVARQHIEWLGAAGFNLIVIVSRSNMPVQADFPARVIPISWPETPLIAKLSPWKYSRQLQAFSRSVSRVIDDVHPDLIYSEGPLVDEYLARARASRVPVIFHPHGLEMFQGTGSIITDARLRPLRALFRRHMLEADITISQGGRINDILERMGIGLPNRFYLPNCTPAGFRVESGPRNSQCGRFLFVGRNERRKGLPLLLKAISACGKATLEVVGYAGSPRLSQPRVRFHGVVRDRDAVRERFDEADFLVVSSYAEGMPTVVLEAFSAGLPVIATDVGAIAQLVRHGRSGFLVRRGNHKILAGTLAQACAMSPEEYSRMSECALQLARGEFGPERVRSLLFELIQTSLRSQCALNGNILIRN